MTNDNSSGHEIIQVMAIDHDLELDFMYLIALPPDGLLTDHNYSLIETRFS
ncbi:hypothetical protein [Mucilaginibacter aquaedulcis]|uniref:hypothetical protein n=1 Tax=Mucilaginibacter aquaedulcis TaxID=1187081 RepID=UPI0025B58713|nr:hypothetical protein [Mucilaginibacter aquaedulcis]MDN3548958.1 hypothetical protein [Mucilaginibacter aquaedulcis]